MGVIDIVAAKAFQNTFSPVTVQPTKFTRPGAAIFVAVLDAFGYGMTVSDIDVNGNSVFTSLVSDTEASGLGSIFVWRNRLDLGSDVTFGPNDNLHVSFTGGEWLDFAVVIFECDPMAFKTAGTPRPGQFPPTAVPDAGDFVLGLTTHWSGANVTPVKSLFHHPWQTFINNDLNLGDDGVGHNHIEAATIERAVGGNEPFLTTADSDSYGIGVVLTFAPPIADLGGGASKYIERVVAGPPTTHEVQGNAAALMRRRTL